jgi:hypothetical protein
VGSQVVEIDVKDEGVWFFGRFSPPEAGTQCRAVPAGRLEGAAAPQLRASVMWRG